MIANGTIRVDRDSGDFWVASDGKWISQGNIRDIVSERQRLREQGIISIEQERERRARRQT